MPIQMIRTEQSQLLGAFMENIRGDARISTVHISLYLALIGHWSEKEFEHPLSVYSHELMPLCKISGSATYHRCIRQLSAYSYIKYIPSHNHFLGSLVYFF